MMKHVLILTCSTGEGHNSAAYALRTAFEDQGVTCELADPVSFRSDRMKELVASLYNRTIKKAPQVFGAVYRLGDVYSSSNLPSPVYWANARYAEKLKAYILERGFDAVVCTHLYGMESMTAVLRDPDFHIPCYGVLTDYVCIPFLDETRLSGYFVPEYGAKRHLTSKGIREDCIEITGIPVGKAFTEHPDSRSARRELGLPQDRKLILTMTGGVGCENMEGFCTRIMEHMKNDAMLVVLVGKNEELKKKLETRFGHLDSFLAVPFTRQVSLYMAACDVLISKPGGLSSTEAAVANIPQVHFHAIPGCETYNARYFSEHGMAFLAHNEQEAVNFATTLAYRTDIAEGMREMQRAFINPHAAADIVQKVMQP